MNLTEHNLKHHTESSLRVPTVDEFALSSDSDAYTPSDSEEVTNRGRKSGLLSPRSSYGSTFSPSRALRRPRSTSANTDRSSASESTRSRSITRKLKEELPPSAKIFKNMLILEESLPQQYAQKQTLRSKYTTFASIMTLVMVHSIYVLYYSLYVSGVSKLFHQFLSLIILITFLLFYVSGEYERTIVLPKKFLSTSNKGLRQLNLRLVKVSNSFTESMSDVSRQSLKMLAGFLSVLLNSCGVYFRYSKVGVNLNSKIQSIMVRGQPRVGAISVKLILNPRVFNTSVREDWEIYRNEFWAREGARRRNTESRPVPSDRDTLLHEDKQERKERRKSRSEIPTPL